MATRKIILIGNLLIIFWSCVGQNKSANTLKESIWKKSGEFCSDSLFFYKKGIYKEFYCEFEEFVNGNYSMYGDTLILTEYRLSSEISSNNPKKIPTYVWKYIFLNPDTLEKVYYEDIIAKKKSLSKEITWKYFKVK